MNDMDPITLGEVDNPELIRQARLRREQADRNSAWLQARVAEIYSLHRG